MQVQFSSNHANTLQQAYFTDNPISQHTVWCQFNLYKSTRKDKMTSPWLILKHLLHREQGKAPFEMMYRLWVTEYIILLFPFWYEESEFSFPGENATFSYTSHIGGNTSRLRRCVNKISLSCSAGLWALWLAWNSIWPLAINLDVLQNHQSVWPLQWPTQYSKAHLQQTHVPKTVS